MEDPTTIALNLTFFMTVGVAFVMFLGLFLVFVATLVIAGVGRLVAVIVMATARAVSRPASARPADRSAASARPAAASVRPAAARPAKLGRAARPAKKEPALSPEWAAAVARADARAAARAKAEAAPPIKVSVRELPSPTAPAQDVKKVAPLVESATDRNGELGTVPRAFKKPPVPAVKSILDTGSLVSLPGRLPASKDLRQHPPQAQERKAG